VSRLTDSCLAVGTKTGFRIYNCDPFGKCYEKKGGGVRLVSMLFCTSLVAVVGERSPLPRTTLRILNTKRDSIICELSFSSPILNIKMNRKRLVVVVVDRIYVYEIATLKELNVIDTSENPSGIVALSASENSLLACPSQQNKGDLLVFDALTMVPKCVLAAHRSPISVIAFNDTGTLVATASDRGTVIRVFNLSNLTCCHEFRRGCFSARITSLSFSRDSDFLTVSSDHKTIHVFRLSGRNRSSLCRLVPYFGRICEPRRDFASCVVKHGGSNISSIDSDLSQILVVGPMSLHVFEVDFRNGGRGTLIKTHGLD